MLLIGKKIAFYEKSENVKFVNWSECEYMTGKIVTVDSMGIFEDQENIYYDIMCGNTLHKHIRQKDVQPFKEEKYEFDPEQPYRLIDIFDLDGDSYTSNPEFDYFNPYLDGVVDCLRYSDEKDQQGYSSIQLHFYQNSEGKWWKKWLQTESVRYFRKTEKFIDVYTISRVWRFEKASFQEPDYQESTELTELLLSFGAEQYFEKGSFYDKEGKENELYKQVWTKGENTAYLSTGKMETFVDEYKWEDEKTGEDVRCIEECEEMVYTRKYKYISNDDGSLMFYPPDDYDPDYMAPFLIHNTGTEDLTIKFYLYSKQCKIAAGETKKILPYSMKEGD